jgi:hypothetical protein
MNYPSTISFARPAAIFTLTGSICMLFGAALLQISTADLDLALETGGLSEYLEKVNNNRPILVTNLTVWIIGVILIGLAGTMMAKLGNKKPVLSHITSFNFLIGVPIVVISYMAWMTVVVRLSPDSGISEGLVNSMGWFATHADWVATILILGTGPLLISLTGRGIWIPKWLYVWSIIAFITGILNGIAMFTNMLTTLGIIIIPVGMGWMIAASIVLFRVKGE